MLSKHSLALLTKTSQTKRALSHLFNLSNRSMHKINLSNQLKVNRLMSNYPLRMFS